MEKDNEWLDSDTLKLVDKLFTGKDQSELVSKLIDKHRAYITSQADEARAEGFKIIKASELKMKDYSFPYYTDLFEIPQVMDSCDLQAAYEKKKDLLLCKCYYMLLEYKLYDKIL